MRRPPRGAGLGKSFLSDAGRALIVLSLGFAVLFSMVMYRYWATHSDGGTTHGRLLFPVLSSVAIVLVVGLNGLPKLLRVGAFVASFGTSVAAIGYSVYVLPRSF